MTATWRDCAKGVGLCNRLSEPVGGFALICLCWRKSRFPATETAADGDSVRSCRISARKDPRLMRNDARARGIVDADLFPHFRFKDLTQNEECYWPNSGCAVAPKHRRTSVCRF